MANELQKTDEQQQSSLPAVPQRLGLKLAYGAWAAVPSAVLLDIMSQGQIGASVVIGGVLGCTSYYFAEEIHGTLAPGLRAAASVVAYLNRNNSGRAKHRIFNRDWWLGLDTTQYTEEVDDQEEVETEPLVELKEAVAATPEPSPIPAQFGLGRNTLVAIREVSEKRQVYFGQTSSRPVVIHIDEMYHVLDVAKSGRGKSNRFRLAMMQVVDLADTYYLNPFAAPVKSVTDARKIEVWQPMYDRLANGHPVRESAEILQTLTDLVQEIEIRSDQEQDRDFSWREHPVFVFIDEVPEIYARCPEAVKWLDRIGRGGRQFGIFAWIATQSALVSDIGLSTASQAQFKTLLYGGGDRTSANRVMGKVTPEQENTLRTSGAGLTLMKADGVEDTEYVRAPLVTNEALFAYFGLPPFRMEEWLPSPTSAPSQRRMRPLGEPTHTPNDTRTTMPGEPNLTLVRSDDVEADCAQENCVRPVVEPTHTTQNDAYRKLNTTQITLFAHFYETSGSIDKSLSFARADSRYREHARVIIRELSLKKER